VHLDINNHKHWVRCVSSEHFINFKIGLSNLGSSAVPTNNTLAGCSTLRVSCALLRHAGIRSASIAHTAHFLEHLPHGLVVIVVQEPDLGIFLVFFKWDCCCN
jgi:hypothetical protein